MGLITKEVQIRVSSKYIKHLESLGYIIPMKKSSNKSKYSKQYIYDTDAYITVRVEHLLPNSRAIVQCKCDYCGDIFDCSYDLYTYNMDCNNPKTSCKNCSQNKRIETNLMIYGAKTKPITEEAKKKFRNTNLHRYGVEYYTQTSEYKKRAKETNQNKRGVDYPTQSPDVQQKILNSVRSRYGVDYISQLDWVKEKVKESCFKHYGVEHACQSEAVKEKMKRNNYEKYGCNYTLQVHEFRQKGRETMFNKQNAPVSIQQKYLCSLYGGFLNYPIESYSGDIVLKDEKIDIEYSGGGHWLSIIYGNETEEEFLHRKVIRSNIIKRNGYKEVEIISRKDLIPSDTVLNQMLSDAKQYFSDYQKHSWITFDIDEGIVKNAEYQRSYFYGQLRKIKKSDLESA